MAEQDIPWNHLAKFFAGELTDEEEADLLLRIKADSEFEKRVADFRRIWEESGSLPYQLDVDEAWSLLSVNMEKLDRGKRGYNPRNANVWPMPRQTAKTASGQSRVLRYYDQWKLRRTRLITQSIAMTAAAVITILTGTFFFSTSIFNETAPAEVVMQQYETGIGERATYTLSDGTKVIMHAESRLEVPETFGGKSRELYLDGEAWFEVTHDAERPFIVRSEKSRTRVLGTKFLVQAWPHEKDEVEVIVAEGKVAFGAADSSGGEVVITKNQKGHLAGSLPPTVSDVEDINWYTGWANGQLVFDNRALNEIIPKLERWYVLDIQVENESIGKKRLSAEIDYSQPMTEVLESIALSLELNVERNDRQITFSSNN